MTVGITSVPFARNLFQNPRPATLAHLAGGGGTAAPLIVNDRSYVGGRSARVTLPAGGWIDWFSGPAGHVPAGSGARTFAAALRTSGLATVPRVRLRVLYADGTTTEGDPLGGAAGSTSLGFVAVFPPPVASDAAKAVSRLALRVENTTGAAVSLYLGGADGREAETVDRYVDGSQGPGFRWEGTADASHSVRDAATLSPVRGFGGQFSPTVALYLVDRKNRILDDLSAHFVEGSVAYDLDAEASKGTASFTMNRRDLVDPLSDSYFRPHLTIDYPDGRRDAGPLGLFGASWPKETYGNASRRWQYQGSDLLWVLAQDLVREPGYLLGTGFDYRAMVLLVLRDAGFTPPDNVLLPDPPGAEVSPGDFGIGPGGSRLDLVTQILTGAGWAKPWVTMTGQFASEPLATIAARQPTVRYDSGRHAKTRLPFEATPEPGNVGNVVAVTSVRPGNTNAITVVVENTNPAHPLSRQRLGRWVGMPPINAGLLASEAAARAVGKAAIERAGMLPVRATLVTQADIRGLHESYDLAIDDPVTGEPVPAGHGRYSATGWSMTLGSPWTMSHSLYRVVPIEGYV